MSSKFSAAREANRSVARYSRSRRRPRITAAPAERAGPRVKGFWWGIAVFFAVFAGRGAATTVVPPEFSTLVNGSDYIVRGVTKSVTAEKRAGAHGVKIVTRVEIEVTEVIAGTPPTPLVLELLGGRVGDEALKVEGMPQFAVGDDDILFVSGNGRIICPLYGMMHGRYPVVKDAATGRELVTRFDGEILHDSREATGSPADIKALQSNSRASASAEALSPAGFVAGIKAALKASSHEK